MDEIVVPNKDDDRALFQQLVSQHGGPAFLRRAQRAEAALLGLRDRLAAARAARLDLVKLRLGILAARAGHLAAERFTHFPNLIHKTIKLHS
jgi:hypothetical protein